ncbi:MAG: hypothetical protein ACPGXK_04840 [Phycisphaerae bacterium]
MARHSIAAVIAVLSLTNLVFAAGGNTCETASDCESPSQCLEADCVDGLCEFSSIDCDDEDPCTIDFCDTQLGCLNLEDCEFGCQSDDDCISKDACTIGFCDNVLGNVAGDKDGGRGECIFQSILCISVDPCFDAFCDQDEGCVLEPVPDCAAQEPRIDTSKKGSLLVFPNIELKWDANGNLTQDTIISITNDSNNDISVHFLFVNGDDPIPAETCCDPEIVVERAHDGWNKQNWTAEWTGNESNFFSLNTGLPKGAPPYAGLDNGPEGPGRPNAENSDRSRVLRGYVLAWAVDPTGYQVRFNNLSGLATIVDYEGLNAWEYLPYAAQAPITDFVSPGIAGGPDRVGNIPGQLNLDGWDYDIAYSRLLMDFYAVNSTAFSGLNTPATVNTDVTLLPLIQDLRQNNDGPVHVKAKFDVWNQNEDFLSHTDHCLSCWDQIMLSDISLPNNFMLNTLQTDKGKSRIEGEASPTVCDQTFCCPRGHTSCMEEYEFEYGERAPLCSEDAPLVGTVLKVIEFTGADEAALAGVSLVGQGREAGVIKSDLPSPPEPAQEAPDRRRGSLGR